MKRYYRFAVFCLLICPTLSAGNVVSDTVGIRKAMIESPAGLLKGEVAGVRVSSTDGNMNGLDNIFIRGLNTLRGDSQPIWIVDGVVVGTALNQNLNALASYPQTSYTAPLNNFGWLNPYEIESVEVIKDLSEAARYGILGANGVVIVNTRRAASGDRNIYWTSDAGVEFLPKVGEAFRCGMTHRHDVGLSGIIGNNAHYNVSGFYRYHAGSVRDSRSSTGGLSLNFETKASSVFHFGMNSHFAYGTMNSTAGVNYIGSPSTMGASRYPGAFPHDSVGGWLGDYDDDAIDYRAINSVWLRLNIMPYLTFRISGGVDYQNQTRFFWFGEGTSFGARSEGVAAALNNSLLNYNTKGELAFFRNFAVKHHFNAALSVELNGYMNKANSMSGAGFDLPYLRGKGLSASKSNNTIRKFAREGNILGAYAIVGYDFDGIAGVDATARMDYNFRFDNQPGVYPAAEAYVNLGRLLFPENVAVSQLKLSGGYGMAGREMVLPYEWMGRYISDVPGITPGAEYWYEGRNMLMSSEWTVGMSAAFMKDRLNVSVKYFDKKTDDMFRIYNFGKDMDGLWMDAPKWKIEQERCSVLNGSGLEIDVNAGIIKNPTVEWMLGFNFTSHLDGNLKLDEKDVVEPFVDGGMYYHNDFSRVVPKCYGGLSTAVRFFGLTVDMKFSGVAGFDVINANRTLETWKNVITESCIEKGDYLRLEHIGVSYDVPLSVRWIRNLKVNLAAYNVFTLTGYSGWNPDVNCFGDTVRSYGIDYGSFPLSRALVVGLSVNF